MRTHELKTNEAQFAAVKNGTKRFEYRRNDRGFRCGDALRLRECTSRVGAYTQRELTVRVLYITYGPFFDIPEGFCCMSIGEEQV